METNSGERLVQTTGLRIMSSTDRIRQIIRHELFRAREAESHESFEEADDFDLDDGEVWVSPYEEQFEPVTAPPSGESVSPVGSDSIVPAPTAPQPGSDSSASARVADGGASSGS